MNIILRTLRAWSLKWRFKRRRAAALQLYRFVTLVKGMRTIRDSLKNSTIRSQAARIQVWWRRMIRVIKGQRMLLELYWNRRERALISKATQKFKDAANEAAGMSTAQLTFITLLTLTGRLKLTSIIW
jgi:hypothetical protein